MSGNSRVSQCGVRAQIAADGLRRWTQSAAFRPAVAILLVGLVIRVVVAIGSRHHSPLHDALDYHLLGVSVANGHGYTSPLSSPMGGPSAFRPPLYPLYLASVYFVTGSSITAARLGQAFIGTVTILLIGVLARQMWDSRVALIAMMISAIYPPLILVSSAGLASEVIFLPFELGAVTSALAYRHTRRTRYAVLAGVSLGLAALAREAGFFLAIPVIILLLPDRPWWRLDALRPAAVGLCAAALVVCPWTVRNAIQLHSFIPVSTSEGAAISGTYNDTAAHSKYRCPPDVSQLCSHASWVTPSNDPDLRHVMRRAKTEPATNSRLRKEALHYVIHHPGYLAIVGSWNTARLFAVQSLRHEEQVWTAFGVPKGLADAAFFGWWVLVPLWVGGLFTRRLRKSPFVVWLVPILIGLATIFVYGLSRYREPLEPFFVILAALAIESLVDRWGRWRSGKPVRV